MVVPSPSNATNAKDNRKLLISEIKPITGGPMRKPRNPIEETEAIATPGSIFLDLPARLYAIGTTEEVPIPTMKNQVLQQAHSETQQQ